MKNKKGFYTLCIPFTHKYLQLRVNNQGAAGHMWGGFLRQLNDDEDFEESARLSITSQPGTGTDFSLEPVGLLEIHSHDGSLKTIYVYRAGGLVSNVDDKSFWFHKDDLPLREMGAADPIWIKLLLQNKKFYIGIYIDATGRQTISQFYEVSHIQIPSV